MSHPQLSAEVLSPEWSARYQTWRAAADARLRAKDWQGAYKDYPWPEPGPAPWTALSRALSNSRIAIMCSGGLSLPDQAPFDDESPEGDATWRSLPSRLEAWTVHHGHYNPAAALRDHNAIFPTAALSSLADDGTIGGVAPRHVSFMGYQPNPARFLDDALPAIVDQLHADAVDAVLMVPV